MDFFTYEQAKKNVKAKRKLFRHFMSWLIVSLFLIFINVATNNPYFWAIFPILGWGVALAFHALEVYSKNLGDEWEEKQIEKEIERIRKKQELADRNKRTLKQELDDYESDFV